MFIFFSVYVTENRHSALVPEKVELRRDIEAVKRQKLSYIGYIEEKRSPRLENDLTAGRDQYQQSRRGRSRTSVLDDVKAWTGLTEEMATTSGR